MSLSAVESETLSTLAPQCRNQLGRAAWFLSSERYAWKTCTTKFSASWCDALRQGMETYPCSLSQFVLLSLSMFCGYGFLWWGVRTAPRGGIIQFYYRIESERRVDTLRFFIDETWQRDSLWRQTWAEIKARHNLEGRNWKWKAGFSTMLWVCSSNFKVSDMLELTCKRTSRPRKWNKQAMASQHQGRSCGPKSAFHFLGLACCHTISDGGMRSLVCTWRKHFWDVVELSSVKIASKTLYNRTIEEQTVTDLLLIEVLIWRKDGSNSIGADVACIDAIVVHGIRGLEWIRGSVARYLRKFWSFFLQNVKSEESLPLPLGGKMLWVHALATGFRICCLLFVGCWLVVWCCLFVVKCCYGDGNDNNGGQCAAYFMSALEEIFMSFRHSTESRFKGGGGLILAWEFSSRLWEFADQKIDFKTCMGDGDSIALWSRLWSHHQKFFFTDIVARRKDELHQTRRTCKKTT